MGVLGIFGIIGTTLVSMWAFVKYLLVQTCRIDESLGQSIYERIKKSDRWKFELSNEFVIGEDAPAIFSTLAIFDGILIMFERNERLMTAGWQSKEIISSVTFFRWNKSKIVSIMEKAKFNLENGINVSVLTSYGSIKIGELPSRYIEPAIDSSQYFDIEADIVEMLEGERKKSSFILYGSPGTGKTQLIKYFAQKYKLPVHMVHLNKDSSNLDVHQIFGKVPKRCIVLFEDFDSQFNGRNPAVSGVTLGYSFDSILNALDGIYNNYDQVVFALTANNIDSVDPSLKNRPSRFKFVREITTPSYGKIHSILDDYELTEFARELTLDKIFFIKSLIGKYSNGEIKDMVVKSFGDSRVTSFGKENTETEVPPQAPSTFVINKG